MRASNRITLATLGGLILIVSSACGWAVEPNKSEDQKRTAKAEESSVPIYKPPLRGAPGGRVGGGTRGSGRDIFVLSVLAPDHTGLTTKAQPSLFWFISSPTSLPVEVTIVDPNATQPLLEMRIASPVQNGVHRLRLADHGVKLVTGVTYQWSIAVIPDSARRSRDILASGAIERVGVTGELEQKLAGGRGEDLVSQYAQAGIWYDALEAVCDLIEREPGDATPRRYRAALLVQGGLPEIAE